MWTRCTRCCVRLPVAPDRLVFLDPPVCLDLPVQLEIRELLVVLVSRVSRDLRVSLDLTACREYKDPQAHKDLRELQVIQDHPCQLAPQEPLDQLVARVCLEHLVARDLPAPPVHREHLDLMAHLARRVALDCPVCRELAVHQVYKAPQERLVCKDQVVHLARLEALE